MILALILVFSASAIQAGDVNLVNASDDAGLQLEDSAPPQEAIQESEISNDDCLEENIKNHTQLTSPATSIYYGGNYKVSLTDSNTNATLTNKTIYFSINNVNYSATTNSKGVASINLKLNPGNYLATAYFSGDDEYGAVIICRARLKY